MIQEQEKVRVAVIGCGAIAKYRHLPELEAHPQVELVAVCDANEERVTKMARVYKTKPFTSYLEMFQMENLDAVVICLPHHLHAEATIAAAQAGVHILCEKPIATSKEEAQAMVDAAKEKGVKLMIGHNQRFVPSHKEAKKILDSGELGKLQSFRTTFGHSGPENWSLDGSDSFYFENDRLPFGVMGDLAIHKIDLLQFLLGESITHVTAMSGTFSKPTKHEDHSVILAKTKSGVFGTITASWNYAFQEHGTTLYCEKGIIRLEEQTEYPLVVQKNNKDAIYYQLPDILAYERKDPAKSGVVYSFISSILHDTEVTVSGEDGLQALEVVLTALQAEQNQAILEVPQIGKRVREVV